MNKPIKYSHLVNALLFISVILILWIVIDDTLSFFYNEARSSGYVEGYHKGYESGKAVGNLNGFSTATPAPVLNGRCDDSAKICFKNKPFVVFEISTSSPKFEINE